MGESITKIRSSSGDHPRSIVSLAVDIGGTFTDVVLSAGGARFAAKVLTTQARPEDAFMEGVAEVLSHARLAASDVGLTIHGTTLATNALIERKGAKVALLCTEGFRDSLEMGYEHRFDQSDLFMERPPPLVPRSLRLPVRERIAADGSVALPLDEGAVDALVPALCEAGIEAVAIGFMHSYANPQHERLVAERIARQLPGISLSLSSDISPEIREYDRLSTTVANSYIQPLMSGYLQRLQRRLRDDGFECPLLIMMSSGGMTTVETACRYPIRLVESGPAGGAILARNIAAECGLLEVVSLDMGGTTAKVCLIDDFQPRMSRNFEVARQYRFLKGSGLPLRIPVIEMVEIGAGGGSIATVDALRRIAVGPESAGSDPGPACYGRKGTRPTVTDADLAMRRIDPDRFAGGRVRLQAQPARDAIAAQIGAVLGLDADLAAAGISEIVDENMANAARIHSVECGKELAGRAMVAFGGAAPLHAARIAEKLGIDRIVVPAGAGVGSAIGFLWANIGYEIVRTHYMEVKRFDPAAINALFAEMRREAEAVVRLGARSDDLVETRTAFMRYRGQGHEIAVPLPNRPFEPGDDRMIAKGFEDQYRALYGRIIPKLSVEAMSWSLALSTDRPLPTPSAAAPAARTARPQGVRAVFDPATEAFVETPIFDRAALEPGARIAGPALIVEDQTTTLVTGRFDAIVDRAGHLVLTRKAAP